MPASWGMLNSDTAYADSDAVLHSFRHMGEHSRYKVLNRVEHEVHHHHFAAANALLDLGIDYMTSADSDAATGAVMADSAGDTVVANYREYYRLLMGYMRHTLTATDSLQVAALANKCPFVDGSCVYNARTLYSHIYRDMRMFSDVGCEAPLRDSTFILSRHSAGEPAATAVYSINGGHEYTLAPNPNDGNFTIHANTDNYEPVRAEVLNAVGVCVYKATLGFTGNDAKVQLTNAVPGMYIVKLTDARNQKYTFKFVVR